MGERGGPYSERRTVREGEAEPSARRRWRCDEDGWERMEMRWRDDWEERMSKCCEKQEDIDGRRRERKEGRGGRQLIGLDKWRSSVRPGSGGNTLGKSRCVVIGAGLYVESGGDWQAVGRLFGV